MIPRRQLHEEGRAHDRRRRQETPAMKAERQRGQDLGWNDTRHASDVQYTETRIGFCDHLTALVPDSSVVWAFCLLRDIRYPSQWEQGRRTQFLDALKAGKLAALYRPGVDARRGDRSKAEWRKAWLENCPATRKAAA